MAKRMVEGFDFSTVAKNLEETLNGFGFACKAEFDTTELGPTITVLALPKSLVYHVLPRQFRHLLENDTIFARLTPEQAILAIGFIHASMKDDGRTNDVGNDVMIIAYYLSKCKETTITNDDTKILDLSE